MTSHEAEWPVFPLGTAFLPGDRVGLTLFEPRYLEMITGVLVGDGRFASVLISEGSEVGGADRRFDHGVVVEIVDAVDLPGRVLVKGRAIRCWRATRWLDDAPFPRATGAPVDDQPVVGRERFDVASSISLLAQSVVSIRSLVGAPVDASLHHPLDPDTSRLSALAGGRWWDEQVTSDRLWDAMWTLARTVPCGPLDRHSLVVDGTLPERLRRIKAVVEHVSEIIRFRTS